MVISLYAHGMSVRDILHHLEQVYGTQLSHETVSRITDAVLEEVRAWQSRPLDPVYAAVFLDAIVVKVRDNQVVQNKPAYIAVGIDADGEKHVLGIWLAKTAPETATAGEGARFWGGVMNDLRNRGVRDILIACCDGLVGFEDAITGAFGRTVVQRCVVHLIRNALRPVARRDAGEVAKELRKIYTAPTAEAAFDALAAFAASPWGKKYPQAACGTGPAPVPPPRRCTWGCPSPSTPTTRSCSVRAWPPTWPWPGCPPPSSTPRAWPAADTGTSDDARGDAARDLRDRLRREVHHGPAVRKRQRHPHSHQH